MTIRIRSMVPGDSLRAVAPLAAALAALAVAQPSAAADGRIIYSTNGTTPQERVYSATSNTLGAAANTVAGAIPSFMVQRAAPTRNERIAGYVTTGGVLYIYRWNGTSWIHDSATGGLWNGTVTVGGDGVNGRRFDIAYENVSGDAIVVYSNDTLGTNELRYRIWNGSTWTAAANLDSARLTAVPVWVKLKARPGSDEIALTVADNGTTAGNNADLTTLIWSGTAWGSEPTTAHSTTIYSSTTQLIQNDLFDTAWETTNGGLYVFFTQATTAGQYVRYWNRTSWGASTSIGIRTAPLQMIAESDPLSNSVLVAYNRSASATVYAQVCAAGACGTAATAGTNGATTAANRKQLAAEWLVSGAPAISYPVVVWATSTAGTVGYNRATVSGTTLTFGTAGTQNWGTVAQNWLDTSFDPTARDTLMLTYSDNNSALRARRLVLAGAGPTYTWTDPLGATLTATLTNATTQNFAFAYDRYVRRTTVATGTDPTGLPAFVAPGSGAQMVDTFTVQTDNGTDAITAVQVTLAAGTSAAVGLVEITNDAGDVVYGSVAPTADVTALTLSTAITSTTTLTPYKIRVTPKAHADMPAPQGAVSNVTARITDVTVTHSKSVADGTSATLVIDNASSPNVTLGPVTPGNGSVTVGWTNPGAGTAPATDFGGTVLVLGNDTAAVTASPAEGVTTYGAGDPVGSDTVVCFGALTSCQKSGLLSSDQYWFRIFTLDGSGNWSTGVAATGTSNAVPITTVATGTDPTVGAAWVAPGTGAVVIDAFTVQKSATPVTGDTITAVEVTFATGTAQAIGLVEITSDAGAALASASNPSDVQSIPVSIASTTTLTQYRIRVTPKAHASMPAPPGGAYAVTARVSDVTVTYAKSVTDAVGASATLNVDNQSSPIVTGASAAGSTGTVTASWTNPAAGAAPNDFAGVVVVGGTAAITGAPTEGQTTYGVGDGVGSGTVACAGAAITTCPKSGLVAGQVYHLKIFTRDAFGNWSSGVSVSATVPDARTTAGAFTADLVDCGHVSLQAGFTGDYNGNNTVTFARGTSASGPFGTTVCSNVGGGTNPRTCTDTALVANSTYYYQATFTDSDNAPTTFALVSGAVGIPSSCTAVPPGAPGAPNVPVLAIVNPANGTVIGKTALGFRVQVRVFSRDGIAPLSLNVTTDGSNPSCAAPNNLNGFVQTGHVAGTNAWIYEKTIATVTATGTYLLRACARNAAGEVRSEAVTLRYSATAAGDGNLLVRDASAQLCSDCHAVKSHSSEATGTAYGSWSTTCADCHQPHRTKNVGLVAEKINAPSVNTYLGPVKVEFRDRTTGDSQTSEAISFVTSDPSKLSAGRRGPCQACHTRTINPNDKELTGGAFTLGSATVTAGATPGFAAADVGKYLRAPDGRTYRIAAYSSATTVTVSPGYAGSTVTNQTFRLGPQRWRNAGNDDAGHYAGSSGTMTCSVCHAHGDGFGATSICINCHGKTGGDADDLGATFWGNSVMARIDTDEWSYSGHGKTAGSYDVTGNVAAAFSTSPSPGITECIFCHDDTVGHRVSGNPFRLRGASVSGGATGAYSTASPNAPCLNCHGTGSFGVNNGGSVKNGAVKAPTAHDGSKHTVATLGGKFCWDCHEPHGDRTATNGGNVAMIRQGVFAVTDGTHGYLGAAGVERAVTYTDQAAGAPAVGRAVANGAAGVEQVGICQACHGDSSETYWTKYWNHLGYDDVNGAPNSDRTASKHQWVTSKTPATPYCIACHTHANRFAAEGSCTTCHAAGQSQTITMGSLGGSGAELRRPIVNEFQSTWSHKRATNPTTPSARTVSASDCGVCHMEGDAATGSYQAAHGDGLINLRDPDTGANIKAVTFSGGVNGGTDPGAYSTPGGAADVAFARFGRNLGATLDADTANKTALQAIMVNQCLHCHDDNGASSSAARVPGGIAGKPFNTTIASTQGTYTGASGYTACDGTPNPLADGCVTNIAKSFATTNSSYHPILGKQNNYFSANARMATPWNVTKTGGGVNGSATAWGALMSCWDCHAPDGTASTVALTSTITAHGGATTIRGTVRPPNTGAPTSTNAVKLCVLCHAGYDACTTDQHCSGSAWSTAINQGLQAYTQYGCNVCHSSGYTAVVPRPIRAEDSHGSSSLVTGTWMTPMALEGRWLADPKPYAFIRNRGAMGTHQPKQIGATAYTNPQCSMPNTAGASDSSPCGNQGLQSYTVGGTY